MSSLSFQLADLLLLFIHLCLFLIYLCICYFVLFTSRHIPLPLFRKCISNHANIWDRAYLRNSQRSLAVDCFCKELHLGCLRWLKSNKLLLLDLSFYYFIDS